MIVVHFMQNKLLTTAHLSPRMHHAIVEPNAACLPVIHCFLSLIKTILGVICPSLVDPDPTIS